MTVYESDLPGVGKKFEVELGNDERLVIVIHNTGKREVYKRRGDEDSVKLIELSDQLSRQVGSILDGAYFQPVTSEKTQTMLDENSLLEWVKVVDGSELIGQTLDDIDFRNQTGATVVAIDREDEATKSNPGPETVIRAGDTLIVLGDRDACQDVESLAAGESTPRELEDFDTDSPEPSQDES